MTKEELLKQISSDVARAKKLVKQFVLKLEKSGFAKREGSGLKIIEDGLWFGNKPPGSVWYGYSFNSAEVPGPSYRDFEKILGVPLANYCKRLGTLFVGLNWIRSLKNYDCRYLMGQIGVVPKDKTVLPVLLELKEELGSNGWLTLFRKI